MLLAVPDTLRSRLLSLHHLETWWLLNHRLNPSPHFHSVRSVLAAVEDKLSFIKLSLSQKQDP